MTTYKYELEIEDTQVITTAKIVRWLDVQVQHGRPCVWAIVDEEATEDEEKHTITTYGTGHPMREPVGQYLGTIQMHGGDLVLHVFWS